VNGGAKGDLYITFVVNNDTHFTREGKDLYSKVELDLYTAILGGEKIVETFDGKVKIKVAPGTQPDSTIRLKGKGFPVYKKEGEFGDLYVTFKVRIPTNLTQEEKEIYSTLKKSRAHG
jgi:curved DNA-binding protein